MASTICQPANAENCHYPTHDRRFSLPQKKPRNQKTIPTTMKLEFESQSASLPMVDPRNLEDMAPQGSSPEVEEMLRKGIEAAQSGDRAEARSFLLNVTDADPDNESAWLWLASISEYPEELLVFLNNVLRVDPSNERALEWAASTKALLARNFVLQGAEASENGNIPFARQCFMQAIAHDDKNETAWLWLASMAESESEKRSHLGRVLRINPDNEDANRQLADFRSRDVKAKLMDANRLAIAGGREEADEILSEILSAEPELEDAWMLKAHLAESFDEKISCFERVLEINDENQVARANLESLKMIVGNAPEGEAEVEEPVDDFEPVSMDTEDHSLNGDLQTGSGDEEAELSFVEEAVSLGVVDEEPVAEMPVEFGSEGEPLEEDLSFESVEPDAEFAEEPVEMEAAEDAPVAESVSDDVQMEAASEEEAVVAEEPSSFEEVADPDLEPIAQPDDNASFDSNGVSYDTFVESAPEETRDFVPVEEDEYLGSAPVETAPKGCPFCGSDVGQQGFVCKSCKAVLTLSDLEMLLSNGNVESKVVGDAVDKMEAGHSEDSADEELMTLGVGFINLKQYRKGYEYLQEYAAKNPDDVVTRSQVDALAVRVAEIENQRSAREAQPTAKTILVVDDSPTIRKLISLKLQKCGHETVCATDGVDALEKINDVVPDLVLLDITMPRMDGYQVCKLIRGNEATKNVPVVMISGKDGFFDKVRGKMVGTSDYITKPFGPETLMRTVNEYLA